MGNSSVPNGLSGIWGSGSTGTATEPYKQLATAQTTPAAPTEFIASGMNSGGIPDYITNWLAQGGKGPNPNDPNAVGTYGDYTGAALAQGTAGPAAVNTTYQNPVKAKAVAKPKATAAPGTIPTPAFSPSVQRAAASVNGATPGAPGATPGAPGATPGASIYDPRYGAAPTINSQVTNRFGVVGPPGTQSAPTSQDLEGITDQQWTSWLQNGGGNSNVRAILGPEQAWQAQGKYADPASLRAYAMWRLGMGNAAAASSAYRAPQQEQPRWGS